DTILRDGLIELRLIQQRAVERGNKWRSPEEAREIKLRYDRPVVGLRNEHLTRTESKMETLWPAIRGLPDSVPFDTTLQHAQHGGSLFRSNFPVRGFSNCGWLVRNEPSRSSNGRSDCTAEHFNTTGVCWL